MIDSHCHLEQKDFDKDRDEVIQRTRKELKAVITCCAVPKDFEKTIQIVKKYENFVFASIGIHPEEIKNIKESEKDELLDLIKKNKDLIVSVGEIGLDYFWVREEEWRKKQKELFVEMINFAKEIKKPITVHLRNAFDDGVKILEQEDAKRVHLHLFGAPHLLPLINENNWYVSIGPIILRSKKHRKIGKRIPLNLLLLETDAPWMAPEQLTQGTKARCEPLAIKVVAEKIAEIRKIGFEEVWKKCGENAIRFFELPIKL